MRLITINGRIAQNVTPQLSRQGTQFIRFSIASKEYYDEKGDDGKPKAQWYTVTAFDSRLVALSNHLVKGKPIIVTGDYSNRLYQSQKTGLFGIDNNIIATNICFEVGSERQENGTVTTQSADPLTHEQTQAQVKTAVDEIPQATSKAMKVVATVDDDDDKLPF